MVIANSSFSVAQLCISYVRSAPRELDIKYVHKTAELYGLSISSAYVLASDFQRISSLDVNQLHQHRTYKLEIMEYTNEAAFRAANPNIVWLSRDSDAFAERRVAWSSNKINPSAILCPRSESEVQAIVKFALASKIPFTVRSGGHDVQGRSILDNTLCIDMRDINFVVVAGDGKSARIGGGILSGHLEQELEKYGLAAPCGSVNDVGYFGWASCGGYGAMMNSWGLGVDNILSAEIVNAKGQLIEASEDDLKVIKGAGGNAGIVTSFRIKVYELQHVSPTAIQHNQD